jgi:SAM-dependent methyltransferase
MRGVRQIVRFNWPFYAVAAATAAAAVLAVRLRAPGVTLRAVLYVAIGLALVWLAGSLVASWIVYDRSRLMRWDWIAHAIGFRPRSWVNIHTGLDESTPSLRRLFGGSSGRALDIFDPVEMTERSILRARRLARNEVQAEAVDFRHLLVPTRTVDAALLLLSAHELRSEGARHALFAEVARVLTPRGRVVVAEHLRDWANFVAFGPGFLHFHSRNTWARCFADARLDLQSEFSITPFVRIFVLRRHA